MNSFVDQKQNVYYNKGDKLFVHVKALDITKFIGSITDDFIHNKKCILIERTKQQIPNFGLMVSKYALIYFKIDIIILLVNKQDTYFIDWKSEQEQCWTYCPSEGYEDQYVINAGIWQLTKPG